MSALDPASKSITISGALHVVNAIKTSVATVAGVASYSTSALNGAIGVGTMALPRRIAATLASHAGSYINATTITITGLDNSGVVISEVLTIAGTDGGTTLTTTNFFASVTTIAIQAQTDTSGAFQFGVSDILVDSRGMRVGTSGNLHLEYADGSTDTIVNLLTGEPVPVLANIVFGDSTVQNLTVYK